MALPLVCVQCRGGGSGTGPQINDYASLKPDNLTMKQCSLELAGSKYKADIEQKRDGTQIQIDLVAFDTVIESERYDSTPDAFSVMDAGGEQYEPPIPLIKYGMHIGDAWTWSGNLKTGPEPHRTTAKVTTSTENLASGGNTFPNAVRIDVVLSIDSGRPNAPSMRKLQFWIAKNLGVVKRSFGDYSTREPLGE